MIIADKHGRIADRLRISLTDRCDLRCTYCMPFHGMKFAASENLLTNEEVCRVADHLVKHTGVNRIRLTGGEPLLRPGIVDLVSELSKLEVEDLALTTNAQLLGKVAHDLARAGLDRVNISLDTLRDDRWREMARIGELGRTLDGIEAAIDAGLGPIKVNAVMMRGINDDEITDLVRYALERGIEQRFLELMAIGEAVSSHGERYISTDEVIERLSHDFTLSPVELASGETAATCSVQNCCGPAGRVGFISPVSRPFCSSCRRLRLSATGLLRGCLMNSDGPNLREVLRSNRSDWEAEMTRLTKAAFEQKPWASTMKTGVAMNVLGG